MHRHLRSSRPVIVAANRQPPRLHDMATLSLLVAQTLDLSLQALQLLAVEAARHEEVPFQLPVDSLKLLSNL